MLHLVVCVKPTHCLIDCMVFIHPGEKVQKPIMDKKSKMVSVENLLGNACFYEVLREYIRQTKKRL